MDRRSFLGAAAGGLVVAAVGAGALPAVEDKRLRVDRVIVHKWFIEVHGDPETLVEILGIYGDIMWSESRLNWRQHPDGVAYYGPHGDNANRIRRERVVRLGRSSSLARRACSHVSQIVVAESLENRAVA